MRDNMKIGRTPSYRFYISGEAVITDWRGVFTEYPQAKDIKAAIWLDIEALESSDAEHHLEEASDYRQLLEVVRHITPITTPEGRHDVMVAGVLIGTVTIEHEAIFSPVSESMMPDLTDTSEIPSVEKLDEYSLPILEEHITTDPRSGEKWPAMDDDGLVDPMTGGSVMPVERNPDAGVGFQVIKEVIFNKAGKVVRTTKRETPLEEDF